MQNQYVLRDVASPHFKAPAQDTSDEALIDLIADGDKRAMQVLYARHNVRVYRFILRLTGNQSMADLVAEINTALAARRLAAGRGVRIEIPGVHLAARDRALQGALRPAAPHRRALGRSHGGDHRGYRR